VEVVNLSDFSDAISEKTIRLTNAKKKFKKCPFFKNFALPK